MKKQALFMVVLLAAVGLLAGVVASDASAYVHFKSGVCDACHGTEGPAPTVDLVSNDGTTATYTVSVPTGFEWCVWQDNTYVAGFETPGYSSTGGSFTVPAGKTYTVYGIYGKPEEGPDSGAFTRVTPQAGPTTYTITPTAGENGSISPSTPQTVDSGGSIKFTITPAANYKVADVLVNGASVGAVTEYTFTDVQADGTISATFVPDVIPTFTITPTAGANGTITPDAEQTVTQGDSITFQIKPNTACYIESLKIDGVAVQPATSYTFENVTANHTIEATFAVSPAVCTITSSVVGSTGGTIVPSLSPFSVPRGAGVTYYFVPDEHYHVESLLVDGWPVAVDEDDNTYQFWAVDQNHTLSVEFAVNTWTLTSSVSGKGSISPSGANEVIEGEDVTYTITPNAGNSISDVVVDGVSVGIKTSYTFSDVSDDHTIQAKFVADAVTYTITPSVVNGVGGSITPNLPYTVPAGAGVVFYFLPNDGFEVGGVTVDGELVDPSAWKDEDSYVFALVSANHTIAVTFVPVTTYDITPTAGAHGSITPAEVQTVNAGDDASFTITPDAGYHVADVLVDGKSVGAVTSYEFTGVAADHTISASFAWTKLRTTATLKRSAKVVKRNGYVKLTATLKGAAGFNNTSVRIEVKKPGKKSYRLLKTVKVNSKGAATYKYRLKIKGAWYFRVKFTGNATYLPAPLRAGLRVTVK